jgi:hypothetical protein
MDRSYLAFSKAVAAVQAVAISLFNLNNRDAVLEVNLRGLNISSCHLLRCGAQLVACLLSQQHDPDPVQQRRQPPQGGHQLARSQHWDAVHVQLRRAVAVVAAAGLARRPEHGDTVLASASELARQNDGPAVQGAARAIAILLDQRLVELDPAQVLQISTSEPFRELSVVAWLHSPNPAPELGEQFARDPARSVRLAVAARLPRLRAIAPSLVELLLAQLRRDPSANVRQVAAAHLLERGLTPLIVEAGDQPGASIAQWHQVRLFTPLVPDP